MKRKREIRSLENTEQVREVWSIRSGSIVPDRRCDRGIAHCLSPYPGISRQDTRLGGWVGQV